MGAEQCKENNESQHSNCEHHIVKEGSVQVQYGLKERIKICWITVTDQQLNIHEKHDEKSADFVTIQWKNLLNIDNLNSQTKFHYFQLLFDDKQHPIIYVYCDSKSDKKSWIQVFEKLCPRFILTNELQSLKVCAVNLGFDETQIEYALVNYHQKHGTVYNMDVFFNMILTDPDEKTDEKKTENKDEDDIEHDLQCGICHLLYTHPVRNIHDKIYCHNCIKTWFDMINEHQTQIKDPYTKKPLPQHCRLLIPHFAKMAKVWDKQHKQTEQMSDKTHLQLQKLDDQLNLRRKNILNYLQTVENAEQIATQFIDSMIQSNNFACGENDLDNIITDALECQKYFNEIKEFIREGSQIYNDQIKRIIDNDTQRKYLFQWKEPEWKNYIDKNSTNWCDVYQIDEYLMTQIDEHTRNIMNSVTETMKQCDESSYIQLKEQILNIILQKQHEIIVHHQSDEQKEEKNDMIKQVQNSKTKYSRLPFERVMYSETNGLVNTKCMSEIAQCIKQKKAFELFHNDLHDKNMNRDKLVRFLETAGMGGIEDQYYIYQDLAMNIKYKMFQLKSYLNKLDNSRFKNYFPYFKFLQSVDLIQQPIIDAKDWNKNNDKIELKVKFECDYAAHLEKYNGNKRELGKEIKRQMMSHLKLEDTKDEYIMIKDIKKGCIEAIFSFGIPFVAIICGGIDIALCVKKCRQDPDFTVAWYRAMMQGALVGGGIGGVIAASTAGAGGIGAICIAIGAIVVGAVLGLGIWYYCNSKRRIKNNRGKAGPGYAVNNRPQRINIRQPGGGWNYQYSGSVENIRKRIKKNGEKYKIRLDGCYCEYDYDPTHEQIEADAIFCKKCKVWSCISALENEINNNGNGNDRAAIHRIRVCPLNVEDNFNVDL